MVVALISILYFSQIFIPNITHRSAPLSCLSHWVQSCLEENLDMFLNQRMMIKVKTKLGDKEEFDCIPAEKYILQSPLCPGHRRYQFLFLSISIKGMWLVLYFHFHCLGISLEMPRSVPKVLRLMHHFCVSFPVEWGLIGFSLKTWKPSCCS